MSHLKRVVSDDNLIHCFSVKKVKDDYATFEPKDIEGKKTALTLSLKEYLGENERMAKERGRVKERRGRTRPSRPIRCAGWIVERMRYRPTDRPTDTARYRGALVHLKILKN